MSVTQAIIQSRILVFNVMNAQFAAAANTRLFLLKETVEGSGYDPLIEITSGYFVKYNSFRDQLGFEFATLDGAFPNQFYQMSAIAYGAADTSGAMDVFAVADRDKLPPDGKSPTYKCFGNRIENERWILPFMDGGDIFVIE